MPSDSERWQADLFFGDLMGFAGSRTSSPGTRGVSETYAEQPPASPTVDLKSGRIVFYDEDTLRFIEGWTRATNSDAVFLVNRRDFDSIRADARRRSLEYAKYLRRVLSGARDLQSPFYIDPSLHSAPLVRNAPADWDDWMILRLAFAGRSLSVQNEQDQWRTIRGLFDSAMQDARDAANSGRPAREFVAYFVLDSVQATLTLVPAKNVTMQGSHAVIPMSRIRGTDRLVLPGGDAGQRVIGDIHTHVLLDPLIDITSTTQGTKIRERTTSLHNGVSDVDVKSARTDGLVVYAIDSKWLHRANPVGSPNDKLPRSGNVLREALRIFGGEPR